MTLENLELNDLRGITFFYENDFFECAKVVLKIVYGIEKMDKNIISKPTINGLAGNFSNICGEKVNKHMILSIAKKRGLNGNDTIDFNKGDERRYEQPVFGQKVPWNINAVIQNKGYDVDMLNGFAGRSFTRIDS